MRILKWLAVAMCLAGLAGSYLPGDAGAVWTDASNGLPTYCGVTGFALPSEPNGAIWMTTYEPGGVFRSLDGGATWELHNQGLESITPLVVLAGAAGDTYIGSYLGIHRLSAEGTWKSLDGAPPAPVFALAASEDGTALYAGVESLGLLRSRDEGATWQSLGPAGASVLSVAVDAEAATVYIGTANDGVWMAPAGADQVSSVALPDGLDHAFVPGVAVGADGSLYAMMNGRLWRRTGEAWLAVGPENLRVFDLASSADAPARIYAAGDGFWISDDAGATWEEGNPVVAHWDITCIAADPLESGVAYLGTLWQGGRRTGDDGHTWMPIVVGRRLVTDIAASPTNSNHMYVGTIDGLYCSADTGQSWAACSDDLDSIFVQGMAVEPGDAAHLLVATRSGLYHSLDGGSSWARVAGEAGGITTFDITIAGDQFYAGAWGHNILHSSDGGATWASIHHGLETQSVYSMIVDPRDPDVLYAGTVEYVFKSVDGGDSWQILMEGWPGAVTTFALLMDAPDARGVLAGTTRGVYRYVDGEDVWQAAGLQDVTVTALVQARGVLCAGTEHAGSYCSADDGETWYAAGLEGRSVYALHVGADGRLWAATDDGLYATDVMPAPGDF